MCAGYNVQSVTKQFAVEPSVEQRLQDKIVEQSTFLPLINVIGVAELQGQNILGSATGPVSGRTDTSIDGHERKPRNVLGLEPYKYLLHQINSDVFMAYATMDAWAKFPDFHERYTRHVQNRIACDREIIGWYGKLAAADTDIAANPLLQDVAPGWLQYMRDNKTENIVSHGGVADALRIGPDGDYENLDLAANDLLQGIPKWKRHDLVVLVGDELITHERTMLLKAVKNIPTEKNAMNTAMTTIGGLPWLTPSNYPGRGLVITSLKNLSIYYQDGSWRRQVKDKPSKDRVEDYNSRNEGYVVEDVEAFVGVEFENVKLPTATGEWS